MESLRFNTGIRQTAATPQPERTQSEHVAREDSQGGDQSPPHDEFFNSDPPEDDLTLEEELLEGQRHEDELLEKYPLWPSPSAYQQLERALATLRHACRRPDLNYVFEALDTQRPLASSCPNGVVFFSRSLLENLTPEQVLFFAAHEIAHTELRHYATRARRLSELRFYFTAPPASSARLRIEKAAVLTVRHQEEFEADYQAARWLEDFDIAHSSLSCLQNLCRRLSPDSLNVPTHPAYEARLDRVARRLPAPDSIDYIHGLLS